MLNAGPAYGRSPGDPYFDPFWARINEAGARSAYHIGEFWYNEHLSPAWGLDPEPVFFEMSAWQWQNCWGERPIEDTLAALILDNLLAGSRRFTWWPPSSAPNGCPISCAIWTRAAAWGDGGRGSAAS